MCSNSSEFPGGDMPTPLVAVAVAAAAAAAATATTHVECLNMLFVG